MHTAEPPTILTRAKWQAHVRQQVRDHGYAYLAGKDLPYPPALTWAWEALQHSYAALPPDPYHPEGNRFRRYSQFVVLPWCDTCTLLPPVWQTRLGEGVTEYFQDTTYNPTDGGQSRQFAALAPSQRQNPFLHWLIQADLRQLPWGARELRRPLLVGVHQVKLLATPDRPAVSSPDCLHQDGEPFTVVHLIERSAQVCGGINTVAPCQYKNRQPEEVSPHDILAQFTLTDPLDAFLVDDAQVCHHVSAIHVTPGAEAPPPQAEEPQGWRSVLLIDFTPLAPHLG